MIEKFDAIHINPRTWLVLILSSLLCILTYAAFCLISENQFVNFDDNVYITDNSQVLSGLNWDSVKWSFVTLKSGNWIPLTWLSHMADVQFFGLDAGRHHLMNLFLHAVNAVLIFTLLYKLTGRPWAAFIAALLFAVHPLRVESVAWASERKDTLSTLLGLVCLLFYAAYGQRKKMRFYWYSLVFLILGLMSKSMLVTWPFIMLLLDYWPLNRFAGSDIKDWWKLNKHLIFEKVPFFIVVLVFSIIAYYAQKDSLSIVSTKTVPLFYLVKNAIISYVCYLKLMIIPTSLGVFYPMIPQAVTYVKVFGCLLFLIFVSVAAFLLRKKIPYLFTGWFWFLGTLVPVIGLVKIGGQSMADRYTYVPSIGISIIAAFILSDLGNRGMKIKVAVAACIVPVIGTFIFLTWIQTSYWANSLTLFSRTLAVTEKNYKIHFIYGQALLRANDLEGAMAQFEIAHKISAGASAPYVEMAHVQAQKNNFPEAITLLKEALSKKDADKERIFFLMGTCYYNMNQYAEAISYLQQALAIDDTKMNTILLLAECHAAEGRFAEAMEYLDRGLEMDPKSLLLLNKLTVFYKNKENPFHSLPKALKYSQQACIISDFKYVEPLVMTLEILEEDKKLQKTLSDVFLRRVQGRIMELKSRPQSDKSVN